MSTGFYFTTKDRKGKWRREDGEKEKTEFESFRTLERKKIYVQGLDLRRLLKKILNSSPRG